MSIKNVLKNVGSFVVKNGHWFLTGLGVTAIAVGTVDLAKTTQKDSFKKKILASKAVLNDIPRNDNGKANVKDLIKGYSKSLTLKAGAYLRPVALIAGGTGCIVSAVFVQSRRVKQLAALYTTTVAAYEAYRARVREEIGEEKEFDLYNDIQRDDEGKVVSINGKNASELKGFKGSEQVTKFSRLIGQGYSSLWCVNGSDLVWNLRRAEECVHGLLLQRAAESSDGCGVVYLNEIYEYFGIPKTNEGMYYGIKYDPNDQDTNPNFRILENQLGEDGIAELKNSWKQEIWLDFTTNYYNEKPFKDEVVRTEGDKQRIIKNRRAGLSATHDFSDDETWKSERSGKNDSEEIEYFPPVTETGGQ